MPNYFFDVRDGQGVHRDDVGLELPDIDTAIVEARRALADMNREALPDGDNHDLEILIRDQVDGPVRLELSLTIERLGPKK